MDGMMLLDEDTAQGFVRDAFRSREWWIIPWLNEASSDLMRSIEAAHYLGDANDDFQIIMGSSSLIGMQSVALAHKRRMDADQLARVMRPNASEKARRDLAEQLRTKDVVLTVSTNQDRARAIDIIVAVYGWIGDPS